MTVPGVVDAPTAGRLRERLVEVVPQQAFNTRPIEERDTYAKAFLQAMNLSRIDDEIAEFVHGARLLEPDSLERRNDAASWLHGVEVGALAASPLNPVLWPR